MMMPAARKNVLLIGYPASELVDGEALLVAANCMPVKATRFEPAGSSFHESALRFLGLDTKSEEDGTANEKREKTASPSVDSYAFKGKKKANVDGDQQDHYALLGLSHLRFLATEEQIRKSYRETALKHHPDKQAALILGEETEEAKEAKKEEIDQHFKAIQEAYEVLIDPAKRRVYDSIDEFDDEVPSDCSPEDFYKVFGSVFMRNARWSVTQPVPSLGEDEASMADVDTFYDFWWSFKSWREFPHADEFDLEQAESREHKRWMERQNGKLREKAKKEENGRIRLLVENAYKRDPRVLRWKEEEKAEKLRRKQAKVLAKQEKEAEAARLLEEERLRKEEEDRKVAVETANQKKLREKEKKLLRKERSRLRSAAASVICRKDLEISDDIVENLCMTLEMSLLKSLCDKLEMLKVAEEQANVIRGALSGVLNDYPSGDSPYTSRADGALRSDGVSEVAAISENSSSASGRPSRANGLPSDKVAANGHKVTPETSEQKKPPSVLNGAEKKERPWGKEEVELLRKAVAKYPKGTSQRWDVVANYIGTGRSVDEILKAIKTVLLKKPDSSKVFDSFLQMRKTPNVVIASPLSTREDLGTGNRGTQQVLSSVLSNGNLVTPVVEETNKKADSIANGSAQKEVVNSEKGISDNHIQSNGNILWTANGTNPGSVDNEFWSETQELALVKALKTFPKETAQRWERIAAAVPGKTKTQCFKKFAELRESFRNKKVVE